LIGSMTFRGISLYVAKLTHHIGPRNPAVSFFLLRTG
jgi:hypothetical protein